MEKFDVLSKEERIKEIVYVLENKYGILAVTLTTEDVLFGDITLELSFEYLPYSKGYIESEKRDRLKVFEKPISDEILLHFPDGSGTVHGHSYTVWIPVNIIASIQGIVPFIKEGNKALRNAPNPLSTSVKEHNFKIIDRLGLNWRDYMEMALSKDAIPDGGIIFEGFELIYSDWEYFKNISGGIRSIGLSIIVGGSAGWQRALSHLMMSKLERDDYVNILLEEHPKYNTELKVKGILREDPDGQDTQLDDSLWRLYELRISHEDNNYGKYEMIPVLVKDASLCYPREYLNYIKSELTIYGELQQIPIRLKGINYKFSLVARAIAFIP